MATDKRLGCQHAVLSFYQPPSLELLERCADIERRVGDAADQLGG